MKLSKNHLVSKLSEEAEKIYDAGNVEKEKRMLVIIPDLKLSGAMTVMLELLELPYWKDYDFYVLSSEDGDYKDKLLSLGATVIIRPRVYCTESYRKVLQQEFDCVFINSAACYYYVYYFLNTDTKVLWWFHETKTQLKTMQSEFLNLNLLSSNIHVAGVTPGVQEGVWELYGKKINLLSMPVRDQRNQNNRLPEPKKPDEIMFFLPAALTYIKGQDILIKAIALLPEEYQKKAKFFFCGYTLPGQTEYSESIKRAIDLLPNAEFLGTLEKDEVYEWYQKCDCVLAPSRVDATPTTIVEAMMFQKLCIVSDATGISKFMQDCVNGFVFPCENTQELFKRLLLVIADKEKLSGIAKAGRTIYENHFSEEIITKQLQEIMG